jgi:DNA-binding transcriptional LysR family regulator
MSWRGVRADNDQDHRGGAAPFAGFDDGRPVLRIGVCSSLSWGFLRDLIRSIRAAPDGMALSILEGSPSEITRSASRGGIDVGFVSGQQDWATLQHEQLWREPLMVLMPEGHPLARESDVKPQMLRPETFLVTGDPVDRGLQVELLDRALGWTPSVRAVSVEQATVFDMVGLGFGLALTTGSALGAFHPGVAYRPIAAPIEISFHAIWRQPNRSHELSRFLDAARALAGARRG